MSNYTEKTRLSQNGRAALWYSRRGWRTMPLRGKIPAVPDWPNQATTNPDMITAWWKQWPDANVGILCGRASGIVVLDIDPRNGGNESFDDLVDALGPLPPTPETLTGGGGRHLYFRYPNGLTIRKSKPRAGLDIQSDGAQVVAPPSQHPQTGRLYCWEESGRPDRIKLADLPPRWLNFLSERPGSLKTPPSEWRSLVENGVGEGSRNGATARLAGHLLTKKVDPYVTLELIRCWNEARNRPPLPDGEIVRTVDSICGAELRKIGGRR